MHPALSNGIVSGASSDKLPHPMPGWLPHIGFTGILIPKIKMGGAFSLLI